MSEALKVEIVHLKELVKELKDETYKLQKQVTELNLFVHEVRLGRKWIIGALSLAAVLGALIDNILKWFKFY